MSDLLGGGKIRVTMWPLPRDGETVPDYPPTEFTTYLSSDLHTEPDPDAPPPWTDIDGLSITLPLERPDETDQ